MDEQEKSPARSPGSFPGALPGLYPAPCIDKPVSPVREPQNSQQDRRAHPRYAVDEDAVLLVVNHGLSLECRILELSLNGCRLRTRRPFTLAPRLRVEVTFKVRGVAFRFLGVIQWSDGNCLLGIHFDGAIARRSEQLAEVIAEIEAAARDKAAKEAAQQVPAETQVDRKVREQAEVEESHWKKIQRIARKDRAGRSAEDMFSISRLPPGRERRTQPRIAVDSAAAIVLVKTGARLKGRILDLSVGGCRIRGDQRFSLGIYTRIETEFRFGGQPFLLAGVIQAIHDPFTLGIRFLDVSERKREQVEQLVAELAEMAKARNQQFAPGKAQTGNLG